MKVEAWIFGATTIFLLIVTPLYWISTSQSSHVPGDGGDWTGTVALIMTTLLVAMVTAYLGFHARKMEPRPEDDKLAEVADGAGELGFFPPFSWWPLWCGLCLATMTYGVAMGAWWLFIIGGVFGAIALSGWVFEYYRGEHAH
jgi:hypothetical protein